MFALKKFLPWVIAIVFVFAVGQRLVSSWEKSIYQKGFDASQALVEKKRKEEDAANRKLENQAQDGTNQFSEKTETLRAEQKNKEIIYVDRIIENLKSNPVAADCRVTDSVLRDRNRIRELGPAAENAVPHAGAGTEG